MRVAGSARKGDISTGMRVPAGILCRAKPACNEHGYFKNTRTCCILSSMLYMSGYRQEANVIVKW